MNGKRVQTLAAAVLTFLLLIYVGYQVCLATHKSVITEVATYGSVSDTVQARCFALRDEQIITDAFSGVLNYQVADGTRVSQGGVIAEIFSREDDAAAQNRINSLNREIESLQTLSKPADFYSANPSTISTQIYSALGSINTAVQRNNFSDISELKENLQTVLNRKQLITGEEGSEVFSSRVDDLTLQRDLIAQSAGSAIGVIRAPAAGYFISSTDGYENVVDVREITDITPDMVRNLLNREKGTGVSFSVGKICTDFNWYLVCVLSDNVIWRFEDVTDVMLDIPFASTETIPATVIAKNRDSTTGDTAVVLECSYMDSDIASVRRETVEINVHTYSGVLVNEKALRFCDVPYTVYDEEGNPTQMVRENVKGVYIQNGRQLEFVQIFTEKTVNGYAICKTELSDEEKAALVTDSTIQLYDNVVVEGTDLYDGKPVQ